MPKFNKVVDKTILNHEGGVVYKLDPKHELISLCLTSLINENKFYVSGTDEMKRFVDLIFIVSQYEPEFILKLAVYARNVFYMRSAPVVMLAEASMINECKPFVRQYAPQIIKRADELTEVVAYWTAKHGSIGSQAEDPKASFPNSLKKGIADAFNNFNEYHLTKYDRKGAVTLKDVLRICHPIPKDNEQNNLFAYLTGKEYDIDTLPIVKAKDKLKDFDTFNADAMAHAKENNFTWEVLVSKFGNSKEVWDSINLPFMAMLRNFRNLIQADADIDKYIAKLQDREQVLNSKQFPFRFFSAYRELSNLGNVDPNVKKLLEALSYAIEYSVDNLPKLEGLSMIAADVSGSMSNGLSERGSVTYRDIATLFGAMADTFCDNAITSVFGERFAVATFNPRDYVLAKMRMLNSLNVGHSTNGYLVPKYLLEKQIKVKRIILFSDMQMYDNSGWGRQSFKDNFNQYLAFNPDCYLYSIDLTGYGHSVADPHNSRVVLLSGWSDKIFTLISNYEKDKEDMIKIIRGE